MLRKVDLAHPVLVNYLSMINPTIQVRVLLPKGAEGTMNVTKVSKKTNKSDLSQSVPKAIEQEVTKVIPEKVEKENSKAVIPSKSSVLKCTKKTALCPRCFPEPPMIEDVSSEPLSSPKEDSISKTRKIRKPQLNRRGVRICDVPVPISPASKKRKDQDVVKKIKKKKKQLADPFDESVVKTDFKSGSERSPIREDIGLGFETPQRDFLVKSTFEETGSLGGTVHISHMDTTTNLGESPTVTIPAKAVVIPPEVSMTEICFKGSSKLRNHYAPI